MSKREQVEMAPVGTLAPAIMGGAWMRVERGWRWNGHVKGSSGGTFPKPGGDWNGTLVQPDENGSVNCEWWRL